MKRISETYLRQVIEKARKVLGKDYDRITEYFELFELVNTYLIHQANEKKLNILIRIPHEYEKEHFYIPTIFVMALLIFYKNYVCYDPKFKIGEIVQKKGRRFEIIKETEDGYILFSRIKNGHIKRPVNREGIKTYVQTTGELQDRRNKQFEAYTKFFRNVFNVGNVVVSRFKYKSVIVASKEIIENMKDHEIYDKNAYKAFPFQYITKTGKTSENLPIDPMVYIVNDYETAQNHIFRQKEAKIDTMAFIGASKYREFAEAAINDGRMGRFQNCIFIGSEDIPGFKSIRKWNWTQEEINYFSNTPQAEIEPIVVDFPELSEKVAKFDEVIRIIKDKYAIDLPQYKMCARRALRLVVSDRDTSRLNNQLERLIFDFEHDETLQDALFELDVDYSNEWEQLKTVFSDIIDLIKTNNPKYQELKQLKNYSLIVVPKHIREAWEDEMESSNFRKVQAITFNEFLRLEWKSKVLFLDYFNYERIKSILESHHNVSILLYAEEKEFFDSLLNRYRRELQKECSSSDRQVLSGIKYVEEAKEERVSELIQRLYEDSTPTESGRRYGDEDVVKYEIIFENGGSVEIDSSKSVLREAGDRHVSVKVESLIPGDAIRIYDNVHRDKLYEIAKQEDREGVFEQIEKDSLIWKEALRKYCDNVSDELLLKELEIKKFFNLSPTWGKDRLFLGTKKLVIDENLKKLSKKLKADGLKKTELTLKKWLNLEDKDKFPAENKDLYIIKKTVDNEALNQNFKSIMQSKRTYRGIMIALGRDMSEEIIEYIQTKGEKKGKMLSRFSDKQIKTFIAENAPLQTVKTITIKGDSNEDE